MPKPEVVAMWPRPPGRSQPVTHLRSTLLVSGLAALKQTQVYAAYAGQMAPDLLAEVESLIAGTWTRADLALAHYEALDRLALTDAEVLRVVDAVGADVGRTMFGTLRTLATVVGFSPWDGASFYERVWQRLFRGGGFEMRRVGPKDAQMTIFCPPIASSPYFRMAFCRVNQVAMSLLARTAYVKIVGSGHSEFVLRTSWV
jgi:hypothetical protein